MSCKVKPRKCGMMKCDTIMKCNTKCNTINRRVVSAFISAIVIIVIFMPILLLTGCGSSADSGADRSDASAYSNVAAADEMTAVDEVTDPDASPVYAESVNDGDYEIKADSSSSMFKIEKCRLTVNGGNMTASMEMSGKGYRYIFPGTAEEAASAGGNGYIAYEESEDGAHVFNFPVEALDKGLQCAAFSANKEKWYSRTIVFRADSLPLSAFKAGVYPTAESLKLADGEYTADVKLGGGSGKASVQSPARLYIKGGACTAEIIWSSPNYDYMKIGDQVYEPENNAGISADADSMADNSVFIIPVEAFDRNLAVIADTTAMSQPYEIEYTLKFSSSSLTDASDGSKVITGSNITGNIASSGITPVYAEEFAVSQRGDGTALVTIGGTDEFIVDPAKRPRNIYLAASSAMDFFGRLDSLSSVGMTSTKSADWSIPEISNAVGNDSIVYIGKYSSPDYEYLLEAGCDLAIESTMIYHSPQVKEKLERIGIPVIVERSSYEAHPLGRLEWIKLYGLLTGKSAEAVSFFDQNVKKLEGLSTDFSDTARRVAFFSINSSGSVVVRKPGDYVSKMIEMAGGEYCFAGMKTDQENAQSTLTMQMEEFYKGAVDADILIYNSAIGGGPDTLADLLKKSSLFEDFKAYKNGSIWCTGSNLFQEVTGICDVIVEMNAIFNGEEHKLKYFRKLM